MFSIDLDSQMNGKARVNLYVFVPHPDWTGVAGTVAVVARDFQRAENLAVAEASKRGFPGASFSILVEPVEEGSSAVGRWVEIERYRDVDDDERVVFSQFGYRTEAMDRSAAIRVA